MELMSLDCPRCGAQLPPRDPVGQIECEYCNATFLAPQARAARTARGQSVDLQNLAQMIAQELGAAQQQRQAPPPAHASPYGAGPRVVHVRSSSRRGCLVGIAAAVFILVSLGVALFIVGYSKFKEWKLFKASITRDLTTFDDSGGPPALATIDKEPAFIARVHKAQPDDQLFIDAYDAQTVERKWRIGPLGTSSAARQSTFFAVVGDLLVVSHHDSTLTVHDVDTGEQVSAHALTDTVKYICVPPPTKKLKTVWVHKIDKQHLMFDPKAGKLEEAERPEWCPEDWYDWKEDNRPDFGPVELAPEVDGFKTERVHRVGNLSVAAGAKHPGTPLPLAVGFDPKSKKVRWQTEVYAAEPASVRRNSSEFGALAGGRYVTVYGTGTEAWHVAALDAKSGKRLWQTDLRPIYAVDSIDSVRASKTHVFVTRTSSLEVFDAETGALLGTVGNETYE